MLLQLTQVADGVQWKTSEDLRSTEKMQWPDITIKHFKTKTVHAPIGICGIRVASVNIWVMIAQKCMGVVLLSEGFTAGLLHNLQITVIAGFAIV